MKLHKYLGMKLHTWAWSYIHMYSGIELHTWARNYIPGHGTTYLCTKLQTQAQNYIPGYETTYPGMKLHTWSWNNIRVARWYIFKPKSPIYVGKFWNVLKSKMLVNFYGHSVYFIVISYIYWHLVYFVVISGNTELHTWVWNYLGIQVRSSAGLPYLQCLSISEMQCCDEVTVESFGGILECHPYVLGDYRRIGQCGGRSFYQVKNAYIGTPVWQL
jgi:hypothetical protein